MFHFFKKQNIRSIYIYRMKMRLRLIFAVIVFIAGMLFIAVRLLKFNPFNPSHHGEVAVGNLQRQFEYYVPVHVVKSPKLLFVLHGSSGTPVIMQEITGHEFNHLADMNGEAIIVYPAGYERFWNDCRKVGTYPPKKMNIDDPAFFGAMIHYFTEKYNADTNEVFAVGFSNGGQMCYKLAREKPQWFKGIAAISASLPVQENNDCYETGQPVSILVMNGTADPVSPYNGGEVSSGDGQKRGSVISTRETITYWLNLDGCDTVPVIAFTYPDKDTAGHSMVTESVYQNARNKKRVALVEIENGGHVVPNPGFSLWPKQLGNVNKDINAPEVIWNFFEGLN